MFPKLCAGLLIAGAILTAAVRGQSAGEIRGTVVDGSSGEPLAGVAVLLSKSSTGTATNAAGEFRLPVKDPADSLLVRRIGYEPARLALAELSGNAAIRLIPTSLLFHEVTVTARRSAALAADNPAPVAAIALTEPRLLTKQNLGEALAQMQSLLVKEYGGLSGLKTLTLRGASEGQVLVLLDGFRLNNPQGGWVDLNLLPTWSVGRMEVMRSGASAQYGSEAVGGIVHIHTLAPAARFTPQAEYMLGSYGTGAARMRWSQQFGKFSGALAAGQLRTAGDYPTGLATRPRLENNRLEKWDFYGRADYALAPHLRMRAFHQYINSDRAVAGSLSFPSPGARQTDANHLSGVLFTAQHGAHLNLNLQGSWHHLEQDYRNPDPFFPIASRHQVKVAEVLLHNRSRFNAVDVLYGLELAHVRINSTDLRQPRRDQRSAFVQGEWRWQRVQANSLTSLTLIPALRFDDYSNAGRRTSPKLSLVWKWERDFVLSWHASAGRSFRVPSMNDLFWPSGPYTAGNPNLRPETGTQFDGGVLLQAVSGAGHWQVAIDAFHTRLQNLISWLPDENFRFSPQNIAAARITGWEPALHWRAPDEHVEVRLAYTRLHAVDDSDDPAVRDRRLLYRPDHKFDALLSFEVAELNCSVSYQIVSRRFVRQDNSRSLPGYRLVDLSAARRLNLKNDYYLYLAGAVNNLFDKRIQVIEDYPAAGREFRLTLGVSR